jgi:TPR repeat protein
MAAIARGGTADIETGFVQLKIAADAGSPPAMALYGLARMAPPGGLPADPAAGRQWLERAALGGDAQAARLLAQAYLTGAAGFAAPDKARQLYRRGHELGDTASSLALARLLARGVGGPADAAGAEQLVRLAADRGDPAAMSILGRYLSAAAAKGGAFDEAILWLTRAANGGDMSAAERLGDIHMYLAKAPPAQDPAKGLAWYQRCADAGRSACRYAAGRAYALAVGTAEDLPRAWAELSIAKDAGYPNAAETLAGVEARMSPDQHSQAIRRLADLKAAAIR